MLVLYIKCLYVCIEQKYSNTKQMYYKMEQETIPKNDYAFIDAYNELSRKNQKKLREKLISELNIKRGSFYYRAKGVVPTHPEFLIIKQTFADYGIDKVFGYERKADTPTT